MTCSTAKGNCSQDLELGDDGRGAVGQDEWWSGQLTRIEAAAADGAWTGAARGPGRGGGREQLAVRAGAMDRSSLRTKRRSRTSVNLRCGTAGAGTKEHRGRTWTSAPDQRTTREWRCGVEQERIDVLYFFYTSDRWVSHKWRSSYILLLEFT